MRKVEKEKLIESIVKLLELYNDVELKIMRYGLPLKNSEDGALITDVGKELRDYMYRTLRCLRGEK